MLLLHQTCAARSRSRARGPLSAFADILIDMQVPPGDRFTRRRHFHGVGRYPGTLQHVAAELNPEGTDYLLLPTTRRRRRSSRPWKRCDGVAPKPRPLTRQGSSPAGRRASRAACRLAVRTLTRGCELGLLVRTGEGTRRRRFVWAGSGGGGGMIRVGEAGLVQASDL